MSKQRANHCFGNDRVTADLYGVGGFAFGEVLLPQFEFADAAALCSWTPWLAGAHAGNSPPCTDTISELPVGVAVLKAPTLVVLNGPFGCGR